MAKSKLKDTTSNNGKKLGRPRKEDSVRLDARQTDVRQEPQRASGTGEKRERLRKFAENQHGPLYIPREMIPDGIDLQWIAIEVNGMPFPQERVQYEQNGWRAVHGQQFGGIFDGRFMPKGYKGEITVGGQVLMERPLELTLEARAEERRAAQIARGVQEQRLQAGQLDGVTLDTQHPTARANTRLTRTVESGLPVPDQ